MSRPSKKQIAFAKNLGIEITPDMTVFELTRLIDRALNQRKIETTGRYELTDETVAALDYYQLHTSSYRRARIEAIRHSGIRVGSLIEREPPRRAAVILLDVDGMTVFRFDLGHRQRELLSVHESDGAPVLNWRLLYQPPPHYLHTCIVPFVVLKRDIGMQSRDKFREYLDQRLAANARFKNEYGEFWLRTAVERFIADFETAMAAHPDASEQKPAPLPGHCVYCGQQISNRERTRCRRCPPSGPLPKERHCLECGVRFTVAERNTIPPVTRCPSHSETVAL